MKNINFINYLAKCLFLPLVCMFFGNTIAQELYVGDGGEFHLKTNTDFTTSNTVVTHHANGMFSVEAGSTWASETEYVDGNVIVIGAGTTIVNIGDATQSTVTITTAEGDSAICDYTAGTPPVGTVAALGNYVLSETEFWTVTNTGPSSDLELTGLSEKLDATYGGIVSEGQETVIIRLDGADWKLYSGNAGTGQFALAVDTRVKINPIVFLQGAYENPVLGEELLMRDDLRASNAIPLATPYSDGLTCDASVFATTGTDAIVDWVWVELRDKTDNTNVVGSQSALIQRDGDIVDIDGISPLRFDLTLDSFYVVIAHRNHLGVITASTVALSATNTILDFSNNNTMQSGGANSVVDFSNGIFGIYAGDYDGNGQIQNIDLTNVRPLVGQSGYDNGDLDMNTQVQTTDINNLLSNNNGRGMQYSKKVNSKLQVDLKLYAKRKL